jgi:hypothetical protein
VIRGGGVDGDHCERDRRGGIGIGGAIGTIISIGVHGPRIGRSTFPRY